MRKHFLDIVGQFPGRKMVVLGDLIADEFLYGRIARISREAPVLVLEYRDLIRRPGGAANAANNLLDLGCRVTVAGIVGQDDPGKNVLAILKAKGADIRPVRRLRSYATPVKTRILAGAHHSAPQQIVRIDRLRNPGPPLHLSRSPLRHALRSADGIIVSDYGHGAVVPELLGGLCAEAQERNIPVVVDSRFRMSEFRGVTSMTPNITELEASTGISIGSDTKLLWKVGQRVLHSQRLRSLLVTQGRFGMTLFELRRAPLHIPIYGTDEVADVTGAGDTVIAVFTLALACGAAPEHAARLANYAGGIVVMKRGTATVNRAELCDAIQSDQ
jgi:rfaE bifunctional protein kinase chain/domain